MLIKAKEKNIFFQFKFNLNEILKISKWPNPRVKWLPGTSSQLPRILKNIVSSRFLGVEVYILIKTKFCLGDRRLPQSQKPFFNIFASADGKK